MTLLVICSAKGAPGATTVALALALGWPLEPDQRVLLVDADPVGADLASGYLRGSPGPGGGLAAVAAARGDLEQVVLGSSVALDASGDRLVLTTGSPVPTSGAAPAWARLTRLQESAWVVLVDAGRVTPVDAEVARQHADAVLMVAGSSLRHAAAARPVAAALAVPGRGSGWLLVVGEHRPYSSDELALSLGLAASPAMAWDPRAAAVLSDGATASSRFARTALMRTAAATARSLRDQLAATRGTQDITPSACPLPPDGTVRIDGHAAAWGVRP